MTLASWLEETASSLLALQPHQASPLGPLLHQCRSSQESHHYRYGLVHPEEREERGREKGERRKEREEREWKEEKRERGRRERGEKREGRGEGGER